MEAQLKKQSKKVVPLHPQELKKSELKWGKAVMKLGFSMVPSLLLRAQQRLGLNPTQLAILIQLSDYWWDPERKPYPGKKALSERLGLSTRQIQRHIAELQTAGLVERIERRAPHRGKLSNEYDLSGLVARLKKLEPEFREASEEAKEIRRQVKHRGGIRR
jgi:DNA-binding MarR family transcriptional regulator